MILFRQASLHKTLKLDYFILLNLLLFLFPFHQLLLFRTTSNLRSITPWLSSYLVGPFSIWLSRYQSDLQPPATQHRRAQTMTVLAFHLFRKATLYSILSSVSLFGFQMTTNKPKRKPFFHNSQILDLVTLPRYSWAKYVTLKCLHRTVDELAAHSGSVHAFAHMKLG